MILKSPFRWIVMTVMAVVILVMTVVTIATASTGEYVGAFLCFLFVAFAAFVLVKGWQQGVVLKDGELELHTEWRTKSIPVSAIEDVDVVKIYLSGFLPVSFPRLWLGEDDVVPLFMLRQLTFGEENPGVMEQARLVHSHVFAGRQDMHG